MAQDWARRRLRELGRRRSLQAVISRLKYGGVVRQHQEVDYYGNFIPKTPERRPRGSGPKAPVSAFDDQEGYELTELGSQFVHYAMTDLPPRIEFRQDSA